VKANRRLLSLIILLALVASSYFPAPRPAIDGPIQTLIIDAGHGGKDPGSLGLRYQEKDIALAIALQLRQVVNENLPHIRVIMTRDTDKFISLGRRGSIAQGQRGDFFVSIHCNGSVKNHVAGSSTYVMGINDGEEEDETIVSENESIMMEENYRSLTGGFEPNSPEAHIYFKLLKNAFRRESIHLADKIQYQYKNRIGRKSYGVKQAPFVVLYMSGMPAVLTETGFITNEEEETFLASVNGQAHIAQCLYRAIRDYNQEFQ
jgi:N-acetylmuramoyl-L-alanine amidase